MEKNGERREETNHNICQMMRSGRTTQEGVAKGEEAGALAEQNIQTICCGIGRARAEGEGEKLVGKKKVNGSKSRGQPPRLLTSL